MKVKNIKFKGRLDGRRRNGPDRTTGELLPNGWIRFPDNKLIPASRVEECSVCADSDEQSVEESEGTEASGEETGREEESIESSGPAEPPVRASKGSGSRRK